jgi:hypothetical protein
VPLYGCGVQEQTESLSVEIVTAIGNFPDRAVQSPLLRCTKPNVYGKGMLDKEAKRINDTNMIIERKKVKIFPSTIDGSLAV